jgi:hypothetical protein
LVHEAADAGAGCEVGVVAALAESEGAVEGVGEHLVGVTHLDLLPALAAE